MALTQLEGPLVIGGRGVATNGYRADYNSDTGPSMAVAGGGLSDIRWQYQDGYSTLAMIGWQDTGSCPVLNVAPAASAADNIVTAAVPVAGAAMTLASASTGITVLASALTVYPYRNIVSAAALVLDANPALVTFGQSGKIAEYDITTMLERVVRITSVGNDSAGYFTVTGYTVYGELQTEKITGANAGVAVGAKTWKFIKSIVPGGTLSGSNASVGTGDVFGLPIRVDEFPFVRWYWNNVAGVTANFTAADATSPATSLTGAVRGKITAASAADGVKKLTAFVTPNPANLLAISGMYGVTPA